VSRVQENEAFAIERMAEAKKDRTQGLLNVVKMIQEMQQIDLGQIQTMLSIAEQLEMKEDVKEDKEVRDVAGGQQQAMATMQSKQQPQQPQQAQAPQPGTEF
jgi:Asp-tRNA(Asn)/Glu-tRNA(Gln) amidotransferase C subunit